MIILRSIEYRNLQNIQICRKLLRIFGEYYGLTLSEKVIYHVQTRLRYNAGQTWETDRILEDLPEDLEAHKSREWI
ncbi:MAG: hypothetical protein APF81_01400 [Desulfosporosinus sp. BRH_c37]|nr:MAG: hypothetical protein APF81_01400 [Desulfosporosinus sp. BRH_c37]